MKSQTVKHLNPSLFDSRPILFIMTLSCFSLEIPLSESLLSSTPPNSGSLLYPFELYFYLWHCICLIFLDGISPTKSCVLWEEVSLITPSGQPFWLPFSLIISESDMAEGLNRSESISAVKFSIYLRSGPDAHCFRRNHAQHPSPVKCRPFLNLHRVFTQEKV